MHAIPDKVKERKVKQRKVKNSPPQLPLKGRGKSGRRILLIYRYRDTPSIQ